MVYCPKCGTEVSEEMAFCPKCGAPLKVEKPAAVTAPTPAPQRREKAEKQEKHEKHEKEEPEKGEKHEKREFGFVGWLVGGLFLILIGVIAYIQVTSLLQREIAGALLLIIIGVVIIIVALYLWTTAAKRHPKP
jgi:uncharacterized membrane protein YvbJ